MPTCSARSQGVSPSGSNLVQVGRIAMLKPEVRKAVLLRAPVSGFDEASRNVDAQYVSQSLAAGSADELLKLEDLFAPRGTVAG